MRLPRSVPGPEMDHVAHRNLDRRPVDGKQQSTVGGEVGRNPDEVAAGTLDAHVPTERCRSASQLGADEIGVAQELWQPLEQHREHLVPGGGAAIRSQRSCALDRRRRDVEAETDHDAWR